MRQKGIEHSRNRRKIEKLIANPSIVYQLINVFQLTVVARKGFCTCGIIILLKGLLWFRQPAFPANVLQFSNTDI